MQSLNIKDIGIWNIVLAVVILVTLTLMLILNSKNSNTIGQHAKLLAVQTEHIEKLEAKLNELEKENVELKQTLSIYNEKNFKKLLITISEHDRKIELLNKTISELY